MKPRTPLHRHPVLSLALGTLLHSAIHAEIPLYDNLSSTPSGEVFLSPGDNTWAQQFNTGEFSSVSSVTIHMKRQGLPDGTLHVEIWDVDGTGKPGTRIDTLGSFPINDLTTFWSDRVIRGLVDGLNPQSSYYVVFRPEGARFLNNSTFFFATDMQSTGTNLTGSQPEKLQVILDSRWEPLAQVIGSSMFNYLHLQICAQAKIELSRIERVGDVTILTWSSREGVRYDIQALDPRSGLFVSVYENILAGPGPTTTAPAESSSEPARVYRVVER